MRDNLRDSVGVATSLAPAARTASATVNGTAVDMVGTRNNFRVAMLVAIAGIVTDGTHTVSLEESDTGVGAWTAVGAADRDGANPVFSTSNQNATARIAYLGSKRYLRAVMVSATTTVGATIGAVIVLAQGSGRPVT